MSKVRSAYVSLYVSAGRFHTHKAHTSKTFCPQQRIFGRHNGVYIASPRKYLHIHRFVERFDYLRFAHSACLHYAVTLALQYGSFYKPVYIFLCEIRGENTVFTLFFLFEKIVLQTGKPLTNNAFGISLHTTVYCGVYLQSVLIQIVFGAVRFGIFLDKTIQRVGLPRQRVEVILSVWFQLPICIVRTFGFLRTESCTQILTHIRSKSLVVSYRVIVETQWHFFVFFGICLGDKLVFSHLV